MHEIVSFSKEIEFKNMIDKITSISLDHTLALEDSNNIRGDFIVSGSYKMTAASQIENKFSYKIPVDIEVDSKYDLSNLVIDIDDFTYEIIDEEILKVKIDLLLDKLEIKEKLVLDDIKKDDYSDDLVVGDDLFMEKSEKKDLSIPITDRDSNIDIIDSNENDLESNDALTKEVNNAFNKINNEIKINTNNIDISCDDKKDVTKEENLTDNNNSPSLFSSFDSSNETYSTYSVYILRDGDIIENIISKYKTTREKLEEYNDLSNLKTGMKIIIPCVKQDEWIKKNYKKIWL